MNSGAVMCNPNPKSSTDASVEIFYSYVELNSTVKKNRFIITSYKGKPGKFVNRNPVMYKTKPKDEFNIAWCKINRGKDNKPEPSK